MIVFLLFGYGLNKHDFILASAVAVAPNHVSDYLVAAAAKRGQVAFYAFVGNQAIA